MGRSDDEGEDKCAIKGNYGRKKKSYIRNSGHIDIYELRSGGVGGGGSGDGCGGGGSGVFWYLCVLCLGMYVIVFLNALIIVCVFISVRVCMRL